MGGDDRVAGAGSCCAMHTVCAAQAGEHHRGGGVGGVEGIEQPGQAAEGAPGV